MAVDALAVKCEVCKAGKGESCIDIITGKPLTELLVNARAVHTGRTER